ncbi:MAG: hypothetical protein JWP85_634 [Rhodoglobus sp.]|nr:hypothetical protein [Rhodoglobus sp.]
MIARGGSTGQDHVASGAEERAAGAAYVASAAAPGTLSTTISAARARSIHPLCCDASPRRFAAPEGVGKSPESDRRGSGAIISEALGAIRVTTRAQRQALQTCRSFSAHKATTPISPGEIRVGVRPGTRFRTDRSREKTE